MGGTGGMAKTGLRRAQEFPSHVGTITPRYLLKIARARLDELDALGVTPDGTPIEGYKSSEGYLAQRLEILGLEQRGNEMAALDTGPLTPTALRQDGWLTVAHVMATSGARNRLMAARMVTDRTDPEPRESPERPTQVVNVTIIRPALASGGNGHQPLDRVPIGGGIIHREGSGGNGA